MATQIAAQLYTIRDFLKTPVEIERSFQRVREIGYRAVQLSGLGPIEPERLAEIARNNGLEICATHVDYYALRDKTDEMVREHKLWGCRYVGIGGLPGEYRTAEGYVRFAREASEVARRLADEGLVFIYHNHAFELERMPATGEGRGRTGLDILYSESDPRYFYAEIDTYWVQYGGGDPAAWIRRLSGRIPVVHLKDMTVRGHTQLMAEVGEGNLNWPAILAACREAGVVWYAVEQDVCQRDPFESLAISLENLHRMGLE
ncbi:MAG TPA: sugar phosphate isomerase/epimerase [Firmicutes bacterium]|nr:sugar phosphate isomerase/epimerase [Bacillota bacterium]